MTRSVDDHALGCFDDGAGAFTGLVVADRVLRLSPGLLPGLPPGPATGRPDGAAGAGVVTPLAVFDAWAAVRPRLAELAEDARADRLPTAALEGLRLLPPVQPRQILQAGANYRSHVAQMMVAGRSADDPRSDAEVRAAVEAQMDARAAGGNAFLFSGLPSALAGPDDDVVLPPESAQVDWEAELAVVIGAPAHRVPPEEALDHVAGFTVCNDVSARDLQFSPDHRGLGADWLRAKNRPTFLPTGPFVVPADLVGDYRALRITLDLNGERMQDDVAASMLFDVEHLVAAASGAARLLPGDLILTGSPAGNGGHWKRWLRPGDVMEAAVAGVGRQRTPVVAEAGDAPAATLR